MNRQLNGFACLTTRICKAAAVVGLLGLALGGCDQLEDDGSNGERDIVIPFAAMVGADTAACNTNYTVGTTNDGVEFLDFRLYVSNLRLIKKNGDTVEVTLDQDGKWQQEDVALLDFEDGTGGCSTTGNTELNDTVTGTVKKANYTGIMFDLGVPFDLNHGDVTTAEAPLNLTNLFWNWQGGYKFARIDVSGTTTWNFHLGSTGCTSGATDEAPAGECANPNRPTITLDGFDEDADTVAIDYAALVGNSDVSVNADAGASGCMSFGDEVNDCTEPFASLGMDYSTGECTDSTCSEQVVFSIQ